MVRSPLNYRRIGRGKPLVILHSFAGGSAAYGPLVNHLWHSHDLILVDLPGFAGSGQVAPPAELPGFGAAVIELADDLELDRFHLLGHSLGGNIALQMALDHGDRLDRLVLYGSVCCGELPNRFETFDKTLERLAHDGMDAVHDRLVAAWFRAGAADPNYAVCRAAGVGITPDSAAAVIGAIRRWDVRHRLGDVAVPTLLIGGDRDGAVSPDDLMIQWRVIPDARLAIVPGCGHAVHYERPDLFNRIVEDFLWGTPISRPDVDGAKPCRE